MVDIIPGNTVPLEIDFTLSGGWEPFSPPRDRQTFGDDRYDFIARQSYWTLNARHTDAGQLTWISSTDGIALAEEAFSRLIGYPIAIFNNTAEDFITYEGELPYLESFFSLPQSGTSSPRYGIQLVRSDGGVFFVDATTYGQQAVAQNETTGAYFNPYGVTNPGRTDTDGVVQDSRAVAGNTGTSVVLESGMVESTCLITSRTILPGRDVPGTDDVRIPGQDRVSILLHDAIKVGNALGDDDLLTNFHFTIGGRVYVAEAVEVASQNQWILDLAFVEGLDL